MNKFICFLSRAHELHLLLLLLLLLLLMLLIALMADITMLLEIPMKVRKSRTPPWGLPHWLLLQKYLLFQLSLSIFVFVPQSGMIVSCQDPERNDDSEEPDWDHLTTDNMLSDNCGLTLLLSSVHTTLHHLYLPPSSADMMVSSSAEGTSRSGDCSPQGVMMDYMTAVVAIAQILVSCQLVAAVDNRETFRSRSSLGWKVTTTATTTTTIVRIYRFIARLLYILLLR